MTYVVTFQAESWDLEKTMDDVDEILDFERAHKQEHGYNHRLNFESVAG